MMVECQIEKKDSLLTAFFFEFGNNRALRNAEVAAYIPYAAAVKRLRLNLFLNSRAPSIIRIVQLEAFLTAFTVITLCTVLTVTVFYKIIFIALGACDFVVLFHVSILTYS